MIGLAVLAPSSHNTQPWRFRLSDSAIELLADRTRALPENDPEDRELVISCGCALMNLRIVTASNGLAAQVRLFPETEDSDLLTHISYTEQSGASPEDAKLADFIETRRTYRKRFASREINKPLIDQLVEAAKQEGAQLTPLMSAEGKREVADLVAEGDAVQWSNPSWRRELAVWMRPRHRGDGLTVSAPAAPLARLIVRVLDMSGIISANNRQLTETSPLLAILSTDSDDPHSWLQAGQALQRILLTGCKIGLQASFLNQPIQIARLRPKLQNLAKGEFPQILLRIGYPLEDISPTPRRALDDVIV